MALFACLQTAPYALAAPDSSDNGNKGPAPPKQVEKPATVCAAEPSQCGLGVELDDEYAGVDNCSADPYCLTHRIYHADSGLSDYITVPDWPEGAGGDPADGDPDGGGGEPAGDPSAPACVPRAPARIPPSLDQVGLDAGQIGVNPHHEQLTGLESWFWWEGESSLTWESPVAWGVAADCSVIPPPAPETYEAALVALRWQVDDGRPATYSSSGAGSEAEPAVRHVYRTKGTWTVRVDCTWQGTWGEAVTVPCGERTLETIEVRSRLTN